MSDETKKESLPDITGVFDIDESNIPTEIIASETPKEKKPSGVPILLNDPQTAKQKKAEEKKQKAQRKAERRAAKRKKAKKIFILILVAIIVIASAVFGIKYAVDNSKKPTGEIFRSYIGTVSGHYDTKAVLTTAVVGTGRIKTVAVFSENDYDIYSVEKGLTAEITLGDGSTLTGTVTDIKKEDPGETEIETIKTFFPDGEYSSGVNYVITVQADTDENVTESSIVDVKILTAVAENAVLVPSTAVHKSGTGYYVWVYKPLKRAAVKQEVSVGVEADGISEITKGLKDDVRVVAEFDCDDSEFPDTVKIKTVKVESGE